MAARPLGFRHRLVLIMVAGEVGDVLFVTIRRPSRKVWRLGLLLLAALALVACSSLIVERYLPVIAPVGPIRTIDTREMRLALTFDISWGEVMPDLVLDALKTNGVKATFFISGPWASKHVSVVRRIVAEGHQVESHGYRHINLSKYPPEIIKDEIMKAHQAIKETAGVEARYIRPPNGDYNDVVVEVANGLSYSVVIWGTDSIDWKNPGVDFITQRVLSKAQKGDIILLHASDTCRQTHLALPAIIAGLRGKGFDLVLLSNLLGTER
jgi:polysaccharide deacetylase family sporulation protein PdaB